MSTYCRMNSRIVEVRDGWKFHRAGEGELRWKQGGAIRPNMRLLMFTVHGTGTSADSFVYRKAGDAMRMVRALKP